MGPAEVAWLVPQGRGPSGASPRPLAAAVDAPAGTPTPERNDRRSLHERSSAFAAGKRLAPFAFKIGTEINCEAAAVAERVII